MSHANLSIFVPHLGCPCRCSFCNQHTISGAPDLPDRASVRALCQKSAQDLGSRVQETEIAFFGGSFTAIDPAYMTELLQAAAECVRQYGFAGIRASTRPDAVDKDTLEILLSYGVTALELGAQSMNDEVLRLNSRGHTAQDVVNASHLIQASGISLGVQMMTGLYGSTPQMEMETADKLIALAPDTVRIYPTVVLEGTELARLSRCGIYHAPGVEESAAVCADLIDRFEQAHIQVIRVGLHASEQIERQMVGGAYHPAFRELCEARRYLSRILSQLQDLPKESEYELWVHPSCVSKAVGQHRSNLQILARQGYRVHIRQEQGIPRGEVRVQEKGVSRNVSEIHGTTGI